MIGLFIAHYQPGGAAIIYLKSGQNQNWTPILYAIEKGNVRDKKFIPPKVCIREKLRLQKVGVTKIFLL